MAETYISSVFKNGEELDNALVAALSAEENAAAAAKSATAAAERSSDCPWTIAARLRQ